MTKCKIDSCPLPRCSAQGYCGRHYSRWYRYGDPEYPVQTRATVHEPIKPPRPPAYLKYGLSKTDYEQLLASQNGACASCGRKLFRTGPGAAVVDHDHKTGLVRGLLCHRCNTGIGMLGDTAQGVFRAYEYLLKAAYPPVTNRD